MASLETQICVPGNVKSTFKEVFTGMNGRFTRFKIIIQLKENPMNTLELSEKMRMDYKTIQRNLKILEENFLIVREGNGYGDNFYLTERILDNWSYLNFWIELKKEKLARKKKYIE